MSTQSKSRGSVLTGAGVFQRRSSPRHSPGWKIRSSENQLTRLCHRLAEDVEWLVGKEGEVISSLRDTEQIAQYTERWSLQNMERTKFDGGGCEFAAKRLLASIVEKLNVPGDTEKRKAAAYLKFAEAEYTCFQFNQKEHKALTSSEEFSLMKRFIRTVIGDTPPASDQLWSNARHGPGAVYGQDNLDEPSLYEKYSKVPYPVTPRAQKHAEDLLLDDERWWEALEDEYREFHGLPFYKPVPFHHVRDFALVQIHGNKITTVPKDRSKDRTIAIEPTMNMALQLGVDGFIRSRLKRKFNIDINDQSINQEWALSGSVDCSWLSAVTVDLSAASDSISTKLVELLFPKAWCELLMELRSPTGYIPDREEGVIFSKLSSMGNGYTFAVETLVFAAAAYAVIRRAGWHWNEVPVSVFGDDIIIPAFAASELEHLLTRCGFSLNEEKSFTDRYSPIRESCGKDYYRAYPVRPVYIKNIPETLDDLFHIHNSLWLWSRYHSIPLERTLKYVTSWIVSVRGASHYVGPAWDDTRSHRFTSDGIGEVTVLLRIAMQSKPKEFRWGRLLSNLKGSPPLIPFYESIKIYKTGKGSVFRIGYRNRFRFETCTGDIKYPVGDSDAAREAFYASAPARTPPGKRS